MTDPLDPALRPLSAPLLGSERAVVRMARRKLEEYAPSEAAIVEAFESGNIDFLLSQIPFSVLAEEYAEELYEEMEEESDRSGVRAAVAVGAGAALWGAFARNRANRRVRVRANQAALFKGDAARRGVVEMFRRLGLAQISFDPEVAARIVNASFGLGPRFAGAVVSNYLGLLEGATSLAQIRSAESRALRYARSLVDASLQRDARTRIMEASNIGRLDALRQAVDEGFLPLGSLKVWVAQEDACAECEEVDGEMVPVDSGFPSAGGAYAPPLHPNCRCTVEPVR